MGAGSCHVMRVDAENSGTVVSCGFGSCGGVVAGLGLIQGRKLVGAGVTMAGSSLLVASWRATSARRRLRARA